MEKMIQGSQLLLTIITQIMLAKGDIATKFIFMIMSCPLLLNFI